jgi:autotransporter family porin
VDGGGDQLKVTKSGSSTTIRATGSSANTIEGLGITSSGLGTVDPNVFGNPRGIGSASNTENNSNINAFANLKDFQASLGGAGDTLNVFGGIEGSRIYLDRALEGVNNGFTEDGSDLLSVSGSITQGSNLQNNLIYSGSGNDTIRIAGSIEDAFVFLGAGNDSFTAGSGTNVDVKGDAGNDYIQFKGPSTDVRINSGENADTVVLSGLAGTSTDLKGIPYEAGTYGEGQAFVFSTQGTAAIDMGSGNDSLVLGSGSYSDASFSTGINNDTISIAKGSDFNNAYFQLGNEENIQISGKDKFTSAQNNDFLGTTISSNNGGGDSLVFGSTTTFLDSGIALAGGSDSIVFGSNSAITNSYINTGSGGDTLVFGSNTTFTKLSINLGGTDGAADRIYFNAIGNLSGVQISGADSNDVLYIGATAYTYDSDNRDFTNNGAWFKDFNSGLG